MQRGFLILKNVAETSLKLPEGSWCDLFTYRRGNLQYALSIRLFPWFNKNKHRARRSFDYHLVFTRPLHAEGEQEVHSADLSTNNKGVVHYSYL